MKPAYHSALRAIGARRTPIKSTTTEYWTIPQSAEDDFYDMRDSIPFENLLSGFERTAGFVVYLDKPKSAEKQLLEALKEVITHPQAACYRNGASADFERRIEEINRIAIDAIKLAMDNSEVAS